MSSLIQALLLAVTTLAATVGDVGVRAQEAPEEPVLDSPPSVTVRLQENRFRPARITVPAGTPVVWVNDEEDPSVEHNVISRDYRWASDNFLPGEAYEHAFDTPGVYRYFCDLHGGMVGQVIVE
jgi:plastocyanin